jgi:hypothetical protein
VPTRFEDRKPFQWVAYLNLLSVPFVQEGLGLLTRVKTVTREPLSIAVREMDDQDRWISRALDGRRRAGANQRKGSLDASVTQ